ncbi:MAG: MotA/TolQ/ExbB proton channel family protein [Myxococcota bacterium]|nr:MotA/TolQ/ExbB proton channel family protein [Myxococcota bacterium]
MQTQCPHCHAYTPASAGAVPGASIDCGACDRSYLLSQEGLQEGVSRGSARLSGFLARGESGEVGLGLTGALAVILTLLFYLVIVGPLDQTYLGQLFGNRGWVPYVISDLAIWSGVLLVVRYRRLTRETRVFSLELLPPDLAERITPDKAPAFTENLQALAESNPGNLLITRLIRALEHFSVRRSVLETVDQLRLSAERDENAIESGYAMLRVFIWAIPILGFIGTVLGIGASVGGFSEAVSSASDLDVMKDSIGVVTSGLGVAFDTTLLALVTSVLIMFPTSSLQKAEEDYLARVDEYCQRRLVSRLESTSPSGPAEGEPGPWADRLAEALLDALERRGSKGA